MKNSLQRKKKPSSILNYALNLLSRKDYSEYELRGKLSTYFDSGIEEVIFKLKERGLLSDERYALRLIDRYIKKKYGFLKIKVELEKRGLREFNDILSNLYTDDLEKENIKYFLHKKPKEKLYAYLIQKGFRPHIVQEVLAEKNNLGR
ncbi:regulatory protein RecX [Caldisericum exile]|uniref:Regulatory protein RecX n=1 Tax=Caldisericum exile (strain DSM 21853 / NBRC 104410 / AZM16c01) TaxID=511051 RepID=A0A7U6JEL5_CALEA|nr:regulatory protein RecX [Caldisericum exile]BAL80856.1 putative regulatory protein RecX [Caldisericum exile AZM16c01]